MFKTCKIIIFEEGFISPPKCLFFFKRIANKNSWPETLIVFILIKWP